MRIPAELAYERCGDELRIRPAGRRITGALEALASFSPSFMAEGREQDEQQEREANICIDLMKHQPPQVAERFSSCMVGSDGMTRLI